MPSSWISSREWQSLRRTLARYEKDWTHQQSRLPKPPKLQTPPWAPNMARPAFGSKHNIGIFVNPKCIRIVNCLHVYCARSLSMNSVWCILLKSHNNLFELKIVWELVFSSVTLQCKNILLQLTFKSRSIVWNGTVLLELSLVYPSLSTGQ